MEQYDFDQVIDRRNTNSLKFDFAVERGRPADVLPLWVADMDFRVAEPILSALRKSVDHGIFGYSEVKNDYYETVADWFRTRFGWQTKPEWLVKTPGVVFALAMAVQALTQPGDSILIQPPVYYPFFSVIKDNDRKLVENELIFHDGRYTIDFEDFERKIAEQNVKLFILCSPHNPVGRVWTAEELRRLGEICHKHGAYVVSDEIHCDFAFPGHPILSLRMLSRSWRRKPSSVLLPAKPSIWPDCRFQISGFPEKIPVNGLLRKLTAAATLS